jgi:uncharacterized membrane protein YqjE
LSDLQARVAALGDDARAMLEARLELARLELNASARQITRLAVLLGAFSAVAIAGLSALAVLAAHGLQTLSGWTRPEALLTVGLGLLLLGLGGAGLAVVSFRRRFTGFEASLAELREDLVWLEEWKR